MQRKGKRGGWDCAMRSPTPPMSPFAGVQCDQVARYSTPSYVRDAAQPHVRLEVAGDGNQDKVCVIEPLSWTLRRESKQAAPLKSQAPSPDPMRRSLGAWPAAGAAQQGHAPGTFGAGDRRISQAFSGKIQKSAWDNGYLAAKARRGLVLMSQVCQSCSTWVADLSSD